MSTSCAVAAGSKALRSSRGCGRRTGKGQQHLPCAGLSGCAAGAAPRQSAHSITILAIWGSFKLALREMQPRRARALRNQLFDI